MSSLSSDTRTPRTTRVVLVAAGLLLVLAAFVVAAVVGDPVSVDAADGAWAYLAVFLLVAADGVCPVFPGETTLNTASTLASGGELTLAWVIVAGACGAICGDSGLYWIARSSRGRYGQVLESARRNDKIDLVLRLVGSSAPALLVAGRYVPGMRFVVNATFGVAAHPYRNFLLWSAIGGTTWSVFTCTLAYAVATALPDSPLFSIVVSGLVTTCALGVVFVVARRRILEYAARKET